MFVASYVYAGGGGYRGHGGTSFSGPSSYQGGMVVEVAMMVASILGILIHRMDTRGLVESSQIL